MRVTDPATPPSFVLTVGPTPERTVSGYENDTARVTQAFHTAAADPLVVQVLGTTLHLVRAVPASIGSGQPADHIVLKVKTPVDKVLPAGTPGWKGHGEGSNKPLEDIVTSSPSWPSRYFDIFLRDDGTIHYLVPMPGSLIEQDDAASAVGSLCKIRFAVASTVLHFLASTGVEASAPLSAAHRTDLLARLNEVRTDSLESLKLPAEIAAFRDRLQADLQRLTDTLAGPGSLTNDDLSWWFDFEKYPGFEAFAAAAETDPECANPA